MDKPKLNLTSEKEALDTVSELRKDCMLVSTIRFSKAEGGEVVLCLVVPEFPKDLITNDVDVESQCAYIGNGKEPYFYLKTVWNGEKKINFELNYTHIDTKQLMAIKGIESWFQEFIQHPYIAITNSGPNYVIPDKKHGDTGCEALSLFFVSLEVKELFL